MTGDTQQPAGTVMPAEQHIMLPNGATAGVDLYDLGRFVRAQRPVMDSVLTELDAGEKRTEWVGIVCPQLRGTALGAAEDHDGLSGLDEAKAYLGHPLLGCRLRTVMDAMLAATDAMGDRPKRTIEQILGEADANRLRACATLFKHVDGEDGVFELVVRRLFGGDDPRTVALLTASDD